jgi:hypothetical protein
MQFILKILLNILLITVFSLLSRQSLFAAKLQIELLRNPYRQENSSEVRMFFRNIENDGNIQIPRFLDVTYYKVFLFSKTGHLVDVKIKEQLPLKFLNKKVTIPSDLTFLAPPLNMSPMGNFKIKCKQKYYIVALANAPNGSDLVFSNLYSFYLDEKYNVCEGKSLLYTELPVPVQGCFEKSISDWLVANKRKLKKDIKEYFSLPQQSFVEEIKKRFRCQE